MNKRRLHHFWVKTRWIKPWYFLVLAAVFGLVCVFALRANNQHMITLRAEVYASDESGSDIQTPLKELQAYVTSHMNTNLNAGKTPIYPPIQLKYTYEREMAARRQAFAVANSQIYNEAQKTCEQQNPNDFSGRNRIPCIEAYVRSHSAQELPQVPDALYKFSFISPRWSPDLAGWTMVLAMLSLLLAVVTFITQRWLKSYTK